MEIEEDLCGRELLFFIEQRKIEGNQLSGADNPSTYKHAIILANYSTARTGPNIPRMALKNRPRLGADFCKGAKGGVYVVFGVEVAE